MHVRDRERPAGPLSEWTVDVSGWPENDRSPVRRLAPPVRVWVRADRIWPPRRLRWGANTPLWVRARGLQTRDAYAGQVSALVLTQTGDVLAVVECAVVVDARSRPMTLLLPISDAITPVSDAERDRLQVLAREIEID